MRSTFAKAVAALLIVAASAVTALALSGIDQTRNFPARLLRTQQEHYYRFTVNYNDAGIASAVKFGRLPSNAFISQIDCQVTTAFNAATTNVLTVGYNATPNGQIIASGDLNEASATYQNMTSAAGLGVAATSAGEIDLYAKYTQTGAAATAGAATCVIHYVPDNDL